MNMNTSAGHGAINSELSAFLGSSVGALNVFHVSFFRRVFLHFFFFGKLPNCAVCGTLCRTWLLFLAPLHHWVGGCGPGGWVDGGGGHWQSGNGQGCRELPVCKLACRFCGAITFNLGNSRTELFSVVSDETKAISTDLLSCRDRFLAGSVGNEQGKWIVCTGRKNWWNCVK